MTLPRYSVLVKCGLVQLALIGDTRPPEPKIYKTTSPVDLVSMRFIANAAGGSSLITRQAAEQVREARRCLAASSLEINISLGPAEEGIEPGVGWGSEGARQNDQELNPDWRTARCQAEGDERVEAVEAVREEPKIRCSPRVGWFSWRQAGTRGGRS